MWTTANFPELSAWGWEFILEGLPWVAHLVWPIPIVPTNASIPSAFSSSETRPLFFTKFNPLFSIVAIPAES